MRTLQNPLPTINSRRNAVSLLKPAALLLMLLTSCLYSYGQTYETTTTAKAAAANTIPFGNASNKIEMTLGASDLNKTPVAGYISKIYLRFSTGNKSTYSNFSIGMTQVAASAITTSTTFTTGLTTVLGPANTTLQPTANTWLGISLAKPFFYDPTKVLVITMQHNGYTASNSIGTVNVTTGLARYRLYGTYGSTSGSATGTQKCDFGFDVGGYGLSNAGVSNLVAPVNFCASSTPQTISVTINNFGTNSITGVNVGWSFDGTGQTAVSYSSTIAAGGSATVTLGSQTFASGVNHTLKAWTYSPNSVTDTVHGDDTLRVVNLAPALSGTFTIDPAGSGTTNFTSFSAAVTALNSSGVCGPVTFNVAASTFTENITLATIVGVSSTNTVTFLGKGRTKTVLTSPGNTIAMGTCQYITFSQMNIVTTGSSNNSVTFQGSKYCSVTYSNINGPSSGNDYDVYLTGNTQHCTVDHCYISGNYNNIYFNGTGGTAANPNGFCSFTNNRLTQFGYQAIYAYCSNTYSLVGNTYANNVIDSSAFSSGIGIESDEESGATISGNIIIAPNLYDPLEVYDANYYLSTTPYLIINNICSNAQYETDIEMYAASNVAVAHNTFYGNTSSNAVYFDIESCISNINIADNIFFGGGSQPPAYFYMYGTSLPAPFGMMDGNDYYNPGGPQLTTAPDGNTYSDIPTYQAAFAAYTYTSLFNGTATPFESYASNVNPPFIKAPNNLHVDQTKATAGGVYAGINVDVDGDARCKLFPSAGADESSYGKSKPIVKFFLPAKIYPGSPTYIYQTAKAGEPKAHQWYLNGVKVSDSVVLHTSAFVTGTNSLKLVTESCGGNDSFSATFTVAAPTSVPGTDFIASRNTVKQSESVRFTDLSTNGPTQWAWSVSPDSVIVSGVKVPSVNFIFGSASFQSPQIQFNYGGKYKICLTTSNGVGKGSTVCKTNYITVIPSINMGSVSVVHDASGYLFDNGGPNNPYFSDPNNGYVESLLIDPCADSVYLTFSVFDTYCGDDYVRLFQGRDNTGKNISGSCTTNGTFYPPGGGGFGFTGGSYSGSCTYTCMPNVTKPDTFKAKSAMFIEASTYDGFGAQGFAAYWWSKPKTSTKPKASFITSNAGDSICVNGALNYTNTTKNDPNDPVTFLWDLDGDIGTFECIGTCATATYPYFTPGPVTVTLVASNCGGSDTAKRTLTVFAPAAPKASFTADNVAPTTNDVVFFTSTVVACVDDYKWTIIPSAGTTGAGTFVNGTSAVSSAPQVNFTGVGFYDVRLYVDNSAGKDSITKAKYIDARNSYCIPSVATLNPALGISSVSFNTINNTTSPAATEYTNNLTNLSLSTSLAVGATYTLSISRDGSAIFDPMNRAAYIDWNGDGSFVGAGEIYVLDSNSYATSVSKKITVPKTAKIGATVLRIAVNLYKYANNPCGQNQFGEYQDYRLYITPYNILPVITLKGHQGLKDTIKLEQGYSYTEAGYSASSFLYGDVTKSVKITSKRVGGTDTFNNVIPGTYIIYYNVTDSSGNKAITQNRVIVVTKDKTPPALLVNGPDTTYIEVTPSPIHPIPVPTVISAIDLVDGPLTGSVFIDSAKVQTNIVGTYIVTYNVTDISGNTASLVRVIQVIDTIPPVLKLIGNATMSVEVFTHFTDPGITVSDNYNSAGQLNPLVTVTGNVDTLTVGTYTLTYSLTDLSGNKAVSVTRTVKVIDTLPPVISLNGAPTDSVAVFTPYSDPGVTASDLYDGNNVTITTSGTFYSNFPGGNNPNITGSAYTIIYTATDKSGNSASVTRTVKVQDITAPVITLAGDVAVSVCRWFNYQDARFTVTDDYNKPSEMKIDSEGTFYTKGGTTMYGLYYLRYKATDKSGNSSYSGYRIIEVKRETDFTCVSSVAPGLGLGQYVSVYPNPSNGKFNINANLPSPENIRISVCNMLGQEIAVVHNGMLGQSGFTLDLSNQPNGIYLLNIVSGNETVTKRIEIAK